ncbi:DUF488 domain-containing protein [Legionella longbeachae]|uniref:Uroporphyrin-III C-methyltransferase n=1 Tax=Legionella longbeachae serogroup 1 (strain NSW150) TaxID=661367 RepID=D3HQ39_LEGLN|nr:DUF488 domain-containing protein [Legionella longbeachae]VEE01523.1 uroporphyrin-III C-methyltransferase [Legionella oakridgensis]HBD7396285.1 DUF488 domain-containing protein [Legionella pneumophila]ARB92123.1 DUF488 domain-containing protein [Legionella longbeachae]ARM34698.1 DUF488 domain-containing protein [Legionella longbeachae]EEZ95892.1 conserved hypothetical protein [Legionella longbeachae D-4968]
MPNIELKRIYEEPQKTDGFRILVDKLWPRGIKKEDAAIDLWLKEIAPSDALRKWFDHDAQKWADFQKRYANELEEKNDLLDKIKEKAKEQKVTLLFASKETEHNNAVALLNILHHRTQ